MNLERTEHIRGWSYLHHLLIVCAVVLIYYSSLNGSFLQSWDDNWYVVLNPAVHGFSLENLHTVFTSYYVGNYAPVQMVSYMLDFTLWGLNAFGYRLANLMLHAANGLLFYTLVRGVARRRSIALLAALVFVCHPVQVETVAWIAQRKNLLAMFFSLLSILSFIRYRECGVRSSRRWMFALSLTAFVLALLSKSVAVIVPLILYAYDICILEQSPSRRNCADKLPYMLLAGMCALLALYSQSIDGGGRTGYHGGSFYATLLTMVPVYLDYLRMIVWPSGLSAYYDVALKTRIDGIVAASACGGMAFLAVWALLYRRNRALFFWVTVFILGIVPVAQFIPIVTLKNDRYLYFPLMGASVVLASGVMCLLDRMKGRVKAGVMIAVSGVLVALSVVSFDRTRVWENHLDLWKDAASKNPANWYVWEGLAEAYHFDNRKEEAKQAYFKALSIAVNATTLNNLAVLYRNSGDFSTAVSMLEKLVTMSPDFVAGYVSLGKTYLLAGEPERARAVFEQLQGVTGGASQAALGLGNVALFSRDLAGAEAYLKKAMLTGEARYDAYYGLASLEALRGNAPAALGFLEKSFQDGFLDYDAIISDAYLKNIRTMPEFKKLIHEYFGKEMP